MKRLSWLLPSCRWLAKPIRSVPQIAHRVRRSPHRHNALGSVVVALAVGFLYIQGQPTTAGTDPISANSEQNVADLEKQFQQDNDSSGQGTQTASNDDGKEAIPTEPKLIDTAALQESDRVLAEAQARLENVASYTATFVKQERIGQSLTELQVIQMRLHHQPLKVFMKWEGGKDAGQRVIFAEGENDGEMLVRMLKGFEARLGVLSLDPNGSLALKHSRYPVTKAGLLQLTKVIRGHFQTDLSRTTGVTAKLLEHQKLDGRDCLCLTIEYASPDVAADDKKEYRKKQIFIDSQTKLPLCVRCYGWPNKIDGADSQKLDQTTLLELYAYKNVDFNAIVKVEDFAKSRLQ